MRILAMYDIDGLVVGPGGVRREVERKRSHSRAFAACRHPGSDHHHRCDEDAESSLPVGVKRFAHAVRSHWGIENGCHWSLDITYREDESRIRDQRLCENIAWLNRLTLPNLIELMEATCVNGRIHRQQLLLPALALL